MDIGVSTVAVGASGILGGKGTGGTQIAKNVFKDFGREGSKRLFKGPTMRAAFNQGLRRVIGKKIVTGAAKAAGTGLWDRYGQDMLLGAFGGGGGDPTSGGSFRGSRPPGSVWNQYSRPSADAWGSPQKQGCLEYAWR